MNVTTENIMLVGSIMLIISIIVNKTSYRFGLPSLILFLVVGMLAGSDGIGGIYFDNPKLAQVLGVVALNFILFSGGLDTKWESIKPVLWRGISLSTLGVLITASLLGTFVHLLTDFTLLEGLMLGSIVSCTDAAAVFSILRSKNIALKANLRPTLELESGSNDPMAYVLMISFMSLITKGDMNAWQLVFNFLKEMVLGAALGLLLGRCMTYVINRIRLDTEGLYPVLLMAFIFLTFSFTHFIHGNGFLAVYLAGLVLGNSDFLHKKSLIRFYDGQAWLMQIVMFLTLGMLVFPSRIPPVMGLGVLISLFLIFVARPVAVFISLSFFKMRMREKIFVSWVGLRGAVPIVFATYPLLAGIDKAGMIFNLVFFISVSSILIQGSSLGLVAKWLKLVIPDKVKKYSAHDLELVDTEKSEMLEFRIPRDSMMTGKAIVALHFPPSATIVMIKRNNKYIKPDGSTVLAQEDNLIILANNKNDLEEVNKILNGKDTLAIETT
ncbi:MAG: potassium/proton antiporter [Flavitalea sp.]